MSARACLAWLALATGATVAVFVFWPGVDLAASGLFYRPGQGFWGAQVPALGLIRRLAWDVSDIVFAAFALGLAASLLPGWRARVPARIWVFGVLAYAIGPGLIVNLGFKAHWGRARPWQVLPFGGGHDFTPPLQLAHACSVNCSFMSGEAAGAAMTALVLGVALWPHVRRHWMLAAGLAGYAALSAGLRVAMGGHFLSDVVFAALVDGWVVWALWQVLLRPRRAEGG